MSAAFDGSGYRQRVLAPLRAGSSLDTADPFLIAGLDPTVPYTDSDIGAHLVRVLAFLQRERNSAKYATLATELVRRRGEWEEPLRDAESRERVRAHVLAARRSGDAERLAKVDGYLATVRDRFGGIPASRVDGLRRLAAAAGVTVEEFDARLSREQIVVDGVGGGVEPLPPEVRRQIAERLTELRALRGGDRVSSASLWAFLGLAPDASPQRLAAAYAAVAAANSRRPHDREKTVTADLLALVSTRLVEGDPAAYTVGLMADAADELRPAVEEHVVLDGELTAVAFEGLVRAALATGRGLTAAQAKSVVLGVARTLGAAVNVGGVVDYVVCPGCGRPEAAGAARHCRYCDTDLYATCPSCGSMTEAAAVVCRHCGHSLRQAREAAEALAAVRRALEGGRPREAGDLLAAAHPVLVAVGGPVAGAAEELGARVSAALGAADAGWRALSEARAASRADAALDDARWLAAQAADVPGPDGRGPAEVLAELIAAQAVIRRRVEAARALPREAQEAALAAVLATAADNREALAALAALPLSSPSDLAAVAGPDGSVQLRWRASPSVGGPVSYRVERVVLVEGAAATLGRRSLGTTRSTELYDAGAPAWTPVRHEVTAICGERRSEPVATQPVVCTRDLAELRAERTAAGIRLHWQLDGALSVVTVERTAAPGSPVSQPPRRARVTGGVFHDTDVVVGATYRYHVFVEYHDAAGHPVRTPGAEAEVEVTARPRPVQDLAAVTTSGRTTLRWTPPPGWEVRIYATPAPAGPGGVGGVGGGPGGTGPRFGPGSGPLPLPGAGSGPLPLRGSGPLFVGGLGAEGDDVQLAAITGPVRLVGTSRTGQAAESAPVGEVIYTPVTVQGETAVVGRAVRHVVIEPVRDLRADDRGESIVLSFQMPPGVTEARVLWRRDRTPTGPDDPYAARAKVTNTSLEIKGGWHLAAPADGWAYHVAAYPMYRAGGIARVATAGVAVLARPATRSDPPPPTASGPATGGHLVGGPGGGPEGIPGGPFAGRPAAGPDASGSDPITAAHPLGGPAQPRTSALPLPVPVGARQPVAGHPPGGARGPAHGEHPPTNPFGVLPVPLLPPAGAGEPVAGDPAQAWQAWQARFVPGAPGPVVPGGAAPTPIPIPTPTPIPTAPDAQGGGADDALTGPMPPAPHPVPLIQPTVTYTVSRSGWRRRTMRVQVHTSGPAGELILFARPGTTPPRAAAEAHELSRLAAVDQAVTRTIDVTLDGAQLPWGVRLLPVLVHPTGWTVTHPDDEDLVVR
ncbi:zinc ribbon domain-containing protein [Frankia tisae]|uniref:zinc ribbon domain-containing protein n=1 Tax=Frankia tisae TaxID=2950104 RepID=UPI0021C18E13|nr:zinc ribbon domain-containing protein [Frankia tisae]